jgi:hypothetical protein
MFGVYLAGTAFATTPPSFKPGLAAVADNAGIVAASAATTATVIRLVTEREPRMATSPKSRAKSPKIG